MALFGGNLLGFGWERLFAKVIMEDLREFEPELDIVVIADLDIGSFKASDDSSVSRTSLTTPKLPLPA